MLSEGKAWNPNCAGFGTRRALGSSSPAVGRPSGLTTGLDRAGLQLPAEDAPSLACLCDDCPDEVRAGGSRSIPPEQNLPSHHHGAIPARERRQWAAHLLFSFSRYIYPEIQTGIPRDDDAREGALPLTVTCLEHFPGQTLPSEPNHPCPSAAHSHELKDICLQEGLIAGQHLV